MATTERYRPRPLPGDLARLPAYVQDELRRLSLLQGSARTAATWSSVEDFGVRPNSGTDVTAGLEAAFGAGAGDIYVPSGDYLIADAGADTGGVGVTLTESLRVHCAAGARFYTDGVDNDMFRFTVPSNGAGLPETGLEFFWEGGLIDQSGQKNSTVVPFIGDYPAANPGASATCDGLSIRGGYTSGGVTVPGIKLAIVSGVTFYGGEHWESAGGDSGVFMGSCQKQIAIGNRAQGSRDLGTYCSGTGSSLVTLNQYVNCFHGADIKRSSRGGQIIANDAVNCVRGFLMSRVGGDNGPHNRARVVGNTARNCGIFVRLQLVHEFELADNHGSLLGAMLEDGSIESHAGANAYELYGCQHGVVKFNHALGIQDNVLDVYPSSGTLIKSTSFLWDAVTVGAERIEFLHNTGKDLRSAGTDDGQLNSYIDNYVINALVTAHFASTGTNGFERRCDPTTMLREYVSKVAFADISLAGKDVSEGDPDSGGAGWSLLRVPNS